MCSPGDSSRIFPLIFVASFTWLLGTALAQCPPASLQDAFVDVYIAGTTQPSDDAYNPSLAVTSDNLILVAFEGLDTSQTPNRREIMAAEFSSSGVLQGSVFPLTAYDADPDLYSIGQVKSDPTVAVDGSIATVAFLGTHDKGYLYAGECDFETPCEALNCNTAACDFDEPPTCKFRSEQLPLRRGLYLHIGKPFHNRYAAKPNNGPQDAGAAAVDPKSVSL